MKAALLRRVILGYQVSKQYIVSLRVSRLNVVDIDNVRAPLDDDLFDRLRQVHGAITSGMAPKRCPIEAVFVVGKVAGQFKLQLAPTIEIKTRPTVYVVAVPLVLVADRDPAFIISIAQAIHEPTPIAMCFHP